MGPTISHLHADTAGQWNFQCVYSVMRSLCTGRIEASSLFNAMARMLIVGVQACTMDKARSMFSALQIVFDYPWTCPREAVGALDALEELQRRLVNQQGTLHCWTTEQIAEAAFCLSHAIRHQYSVYRSLSFVQYLTEAAELAVQKQVQLASRAPSKLHVDNKRIGGSIDDSFRTLLTLAARISWQDTSIVTLWEGWQKFGRIAVPVASWSSSWLIEVLHAHVRLQLRSGLLDSVVRCLLDVGEPPSSHSCSPGKGAILPEQPMSVHDITTRLRSDSLLTFNLAHVLLQPTAPLLPVQLSKATSALSLLHSVISGCIRVKRSMENLHRLDKNHSTVADRETLVSSRQVYTALTMLQVLPNALPWSRPVATIPTLLTETFQNTGRGDKGRTAKKDVDSYARSCLSWKLVSLRDLHSICQVASVTAARLSERQAVCDVAKCTEVMSKRLSSIQAPTADRSVCNALEPDKPENSSSATRDDASTVHHIRLSIIDVLSGLLSDAEWHDAQGTQPDQPGVIRSHVSVGPFVVDVIGVDIRRFN
eukprot:GHVQ01019735.1.p1 GENE.GHVQ01019735.1~~GHVQ01019735.1.p1  ORF type:complete len:538 (+),score=37.82 GHVQ01019735.1:2040-3653(+)